MRARKILAYGLGGVVALAGFVFVGLQTPPGQRALTAIVSDVASTPDSRLTLSGLGGFFPTDLQLARIEMADRQGTWLKVEDARLRWSFASLFTGRLRIEALSAGRIEVLRAPESPPSESAPGGSGPLRLPVGIDLQVLSVDDLQLAAALARVDSRWKIAGNAFLPADLAEGRLKLTGDRTDGLSGRVAADIRFDAGRRTVDGEVVVDERRGGIVAAFLERPELEQVSIRLAARGDANAGSADLTISAGDAATATGKANWEPKGAATAVSVRLDTAGPGLPQGALADVARGPMSLSADAVIDENAVTLSDAKLTTGPVGLAASGRYDRAGDRLDATVILQAAEPGPFGAFLGGASWRGLRLQAKADLGNLARQPLGTITLGGGADELLISALDPRLPPPGKVALESKVDVRDGKLSLEALDVTSPLAAVKGNGAYAIGSQSGEGKVTVELPSLEPLSALAGRALSGNATLELTGKSAAGDLTLGWQGVVRNIGTPDLPQDLVASTVRLAGSATLKRDETWSLSDVRVTSDGGSLGIAGRGRGATGTLDLTLDLPKLGILGSDISGAATASATIGLSGAGTDLKVGAELNDLAHRQLTSRRLLLAATMSLDKTGAARGTVEANGDLAGQALSLNGRFERDASGGVVVPTFKGHWASAVLDVANLAVTEARTSGHARLKMARLQDTAGLIGTNLAGSIDAEVTADPQSPNGRLDVRVQGADLRSGGLAVGALNLGGTIDDPMGAATTDVTLTANRLAGVAGIGGIRATAKGDRRAMDVTLQASGAQTNASLAARIERSGEEIRIALSRFEGRHQGIPVALAAPTRVTVAGARIVIDPTTLRLGGGRLVARGTLDPTASDLQLELAALPLSLIDSLAPGTGLEGTLQARLRATGPMGAPRVEATYNASGLRLRRPDAALVPALSLQGTGSLVGQQASIDARLTAGGATNLSLRGKATIPQGAAPLAATASVTGTIDIAPFAPLLGNDIRNVAGTVRPNLTLDVTGSRVTGNGTIDLGGGVVALPAAGLRLGSGEGRLVLQGDVLQVQRLSFQTGRSGAVSASGTMRFDEQQALVLDLGIAARRALLVNRPDLVATVSSDLKITGSTGDGIDVAGPITIDRAEIAVGGQQSADFPTIEVREINKPGAAAATPSSAPAARQPQAAAAAAAPAPVRLALTIRAPQAVFVRGRGLDAEMGGELQVTGSPDAPSVVGGLTLRRGDFSLGGRRLTFARGVVTLDNVNTIDPQLDFVATTNVQSTSIQVAITGTSRAPVIAVTSSPSLPPDEAMALLIFGKPASSLSAFELVQVAQALADLSGRSPGTGILSRLRRGLGLDQLSVGSSGGGSSGGASSDSVSLEAGRYVMPGVYVGARQGAAGNSSRGVVQIEVLDNVKLEGDIGANSTGRVGAKMEWDY